MRQEGVPAMPKQHVVVLTPEQRRECGAVLRRGRSPALTQRRARILLATDAGPDGPHRTDVDVAAMTEVTARTVARVRTTFCQHGLPWPCGDARVRGPCRPSSMPCRRPA